LNDKVSKKSLKTISYIPASRLGHSKSRGTIAEKRRNEEDAITTNNIWKITKRFTKQRTQLHTPAIHGGRELIYTSLDKATAVTEVYGDKFRSNPQE
jgi:hypothetical protein